MPRLVKLFLLLLRARAWLAATFATLTLAGAYAASRVPDDPSIDRLAVEGDAVALATAQFERVFPEGDRALLLLEAPDPLSPQMLRAANRLERRLAGIAHLETQSLLSLSMGEAAGGDISADQAAHLRSLAMGTQLLRRAGILDDHDLGISLELHVDSPAQRDAVLASIDEVIRSEKAAGAPFTRVHRVGGPWVDAWLERQTAQATRHFMPLFGLFLMALVLVVYRSWRAFASIILTLASAVAMAAGLAELFGWSQTIVSALVPLTVMVTTTSTLVYLQSRYMQPDRSPSLAEHHARALANKFVPCTASMFATAVGFAALAVSDIRPVREMGLWTACGLIVAWVSCFTLFPALQSLLRAPVRTERARHGAAFTALVDVLGPATRRHRRLLVAVALAAMVCGAVSLFGIPGRLAPLGVQTDALTYMDPKDPIAQDTRRFQQSGGLDIVDLWLRTPPGHALDPEFLRAIHQLAERLEQDPRITAVEGPTAALRWLQYVRSGSDRLPVAPDAWPALASELKQILSSDSGMRAYVEPRRLADVRLSIRGRADLFGSTDRMRRFIEQTWAIALAQEPALHGVDGAVVGRGALSAMITERLLPTLTQSFAITASVIFVAFLIVFRNPAARLMTMIPSLFAILSVFMVMRFTGIALNIATILIASTILGATENDQIHFFYHFQEGSSCGSLAEALRHAFLTAGRPILFATLINVSGFLALSLSDLPPMREFGIVASSAFVLALLADFTALPAALWMLGAGARGRASMPA